MRLTMFLRNRKPQPGAFGSALTMGIKNTFKRSAAGMAGAVIQSFQGETNQAGGGIGRMGELAHSARVR